MFLRNVNKCNEQTILYSCYLVWFSVGIGGDDDGGSVWVLPVGIVGAGIITCESGAGGGTGTGWGITTVVTAGWIIAEPGPPLFSVVFNPK